MARVEVPPPPELPARKALPAARRQIAPLDAAFLARIYRTTWWLGAVWAVAVWGWSQSWGVTFSFVAGVATAALLLKSQEFFVRRVLTPRTPRREEGCQNGSVPCCDKIDLWRRVPLALLLPLKYVVIGLAFGFFLQRGRLQPAAFAVGFGFEQLVILSKVLGHALNRKAS